METIARDTSAAEAGWETERGHVDACVSQPTLAASCLLRRLVQTA